MNTKTGIEKWRELDGDNTLALDWPLNEDSHVWEIGGFEGRWAQQIWDKFHCNITIFEPQLWAVEKMKARFKGIEKIDIRPYGLWLNDEVLQLGNYHTDGASLVNNDGREITMPAYFKGFYHEVYNFNHELDLTLMNIEGGEYTLIPNMVASGIMPRFNYFWCQFHIQHSNPKIVEPEKESVFIDQYYYNLMNETHEIIWDCHPTAVAWKRKKYWQDEYDYRDRLKKEKLVNK